MPIPAIVLAGLAGLTGASGLIQMNRGKEDAKQLVRPEFNGADDIENLLQMLYGQAQFGIDPNSLGFANEVNQNALGESIQAILTAGGDPNSINSIYGNYTDATERLAVADSDRRWQKINALAEGTKLLYDAKKEEFLYNEDGPYKDKAQAAAARQKSGYNQLFSALDLLGAGLTGGGTDWFGGGKNSVGGNNVGGMGAVLKQMAGNV